MPLGLTVIKEYERGVVLRFGKLQPKVREPGLRFYAPLADRMQKVSLRIITLPVESQKIITKDNVSIDVAAVAYYQKIDPIRSVVEIDDIRSATYQIALTTVRNVVGQSVLDEVLSSTHLINEKIKSILDIATEQWGVYVATVELKDIRLPESMQRAMAREAEAEREKRAKIIAAEGEQMSAKALGDAADVMADHPIALQLRHLQVLAEISGEGNSTIIFPAQIMDSFKAVKEFVTSEVSQ